MAQDVAKLGIIDDSADWNPPPALPLNLRSHLGRFGIGNDDLVVIEGLPEGAELTVGVCKPDGSWSLQAAEIDNAAFIPLYENGETYALKVCLLTPDPSDHGLPKTKGKAQFSLAVPLAPLPVLETLDEVAPKKRAAAATETVILMGADPALKAAPAAAPQPVAPPPQPLAAQPAAVVIPAAAPIAAAPTTPPAAAVSTAAAPVAAATPAPTAAPMAAVDFDRHFAALSAAWQTNVKNQVAAAEKRLKAAHLQQLSKIQTVLSQEEAARTTAMATKWKAEMDQRATEAETALKARAQEHLAGLETRLRSAPEARTDAASGTTAEFEQRLAAARQQWQVEEEARLAAVEAEWSAAALMQASAPSAAPDPAAIKRAVAEARAAWEIEEAARRAKDAAELAAAHQRQVAQLEAQYNALQEMRLNNAESAWRKSEAERLAAAERDWGKREAERMAGVEATWRTEHDKRLEVVLANLDTMVRGQLGTIDGSQPLPPIEPTIAAPAPTLADDHASGESTAVDDDVRWRKTAAA
jgi:hypothetical protein